MGHLAQGCLKIKAGSAFGMDWASMSSERHHPISSGSKVCIPGRKQSYCVVWFTLESLVAIHSVLITDTDILLLTVFVFAAPFALPLCIVLWIIDFGMFCGLHFCLMLFGLLELIGYTWTEPEFPCCLCTVACVYIKCSLRKHFAFRPSHDNQVKALFFVFIFKYLNI